MTTYKCNLKLLLAGLLSAQCHPYEYLDRRRRYRAKSDIWTRPKRRVIFGYYDAEIAVVQLERNVAARTPSANLDHRKYSIEV